MQSRTVLWIALLTLVAAGTATAQVPFMPEFGIKGGINFSSINTDDLKASSRAGYAAGVYLDLATPLLHLQPEALLSSKGFKGGAVGVAGRELAYREVVLEVPVLLVFSLPIPMLSPRAFAGPAMSIPLKSEVDLKGDWVDIKGDMKTSWSLILGAGVKVGKFGVDLRYDIGVTSLNDRPMGDILHDAFSEIDDPYKDIKDRTFALLISFALN